MTSSASQLIGLGMPAILAARVGNTIATYAGVGTAQTGAKALTTNQGLLATTGGATAFVLSTIWAQGDQVQVWNTSSTTALIFPPSGCAFDGGSTDASISLLQNNSVIMERVSSTSWRTMNTSSAAGSFTNVTATGSIKSSSATGGVGYATGAGTAVTQGTSRTTGVTSDTPSGAITLVSAAGSTTPATFTVTCASVAATDVVIVNQKSGTDLYTISVSRVAAGAFDITFNTKSGTTTEQPVFNYAVIKAVAA